MKNYPMSRAEAKKVNEQLESEGFLPQNLPKELRKAIVNLNMRHFKVSRNIAAETMFCGWTVFVNPKGKWQVEEVGEVTIHYQFDGKNFV